VKLCSIDMSPGSAAAAAATTKSPHTWADTPKLLRNRHTRGPPDIRYGGSDSLSVAGSTRSAKEREEEYERAKARIFGVGGEGAPVVPYPMNGGYVAAAAAAGGGGGPHSYGSAGAGRGGGGGRGFAPGRAGRGRGRGRDDASSHSSDADAYLRASSVMAPGARCVSKTCPSCAQVVSRQVGAGTGGAGGGAAPSVCTQTSFVAFLVWTEYAGEQPTAWMHVLPAPVLADIGCRYPIMPVPMYDQHGNIVMAMPPPMYAMPHQAEVRTTAPAVHAAMQLQQIGHGYDRRGACRE
jgi:hypothetical protein